MLAPSIMNSFKKFQEANKKTIIALNKAIEKYEKSRRNSTENQEN